MTEVLFSLFIVLVFAFALFFPKMQRDIEDVKRRLANMGIPDPRGLPIRPESPRKQFVAENWDNPIGAMPTWRGEPVSMDFGRRLSGAKRLSEQMEP